MGNLYHWGKKLVALIHQDPNDTKALVKDVRTNAKYNVLFNQLEPVNKPKRKKVYNFPLYDACPTCKTPFQIPGIECPGCGFKEWITAQDQ